MKDEEEMTKNGTGIDRARRRKKKADTENRRRGIKDGGGKRRETMNDERGETEVGTEGSERGIPKDERTKRRKAR